jgi:hypothetical protein
VALLRDKFRIVTATRVTREQFPRSTALGRSLALYPFVDLRLFPENSAGLPVVYNTALREAASDPAIMIFVHDDVYLCDFFWYKHVYDGLKVFDVIGAVGNKRRVPNQSSWLFVDDKGSWDEMQHLSGMIAHGTGFPPQRFENFGPPCQEVKLLDGVLLAARSETLLSKNLDFDERFEFHFYDMDFCRQAEHRNVRMGTWIMSLVHESRGVAGDSSWRRQYRQYLDKWQC